MKFRLLSVVAPAKTPSGFDAHMYGSIRNHTAFSGDVSGAAKHHDSVLNDALDERREAVYAAVSGGKMVLHISCCWTVC
jgi:hypothetical protein